MNVYTVTVKTAYSEPCTFSFRKQRQAERFAATARTRMVRGGVPEDELSIVTDFSVLDDVVSAYNAIDEMIANV